MFNPSRPLRRVGVPVLAAATAMTGTYILVDRDGTPAPAAAKTVTMDHSQHVSMQPDSNAPAGAPAHWLPKDAWVMQHLLPFDEARLYTLLHVTRKDVKRHLKTHGNTLAALAAQHGYADQAALTEALLEPRKADVTPEQYATLADRTRDVLTQSHLAQHVLFHVFHVPAIAKQAETVFGVSPKAFRQARKAGKTPVEIAKTGGTTESELELHVKTLLEDGYEDAVKRGDTSAAQAKVMLALQMGAFDRWKDKVAKKAR